jgi:hypothetical protein
MSAQQRVDQQVNNVTDLRNTFQEIRAEVGGANTREDLTKLYRRAGVLVTLTNSPPWRRKFGPAADELRRVAEEEFKRTARVINQRAADKSGHRVIRRFGHFGAPGLAGLSARDRGQGRIRPMGAAQKVIDRVSSARVRRSGCPH